MNEHLQMVRSAEGRRGNWELRSAAIVSPAVVAVGKTRRIDTHVSNGLALDLSGRVSVETWLTSADDSLYNLTVIRSKFSVEAEHA